MEIVFFFFYHYVVDFASSSQKSIYNVNFFWLDYCAVIDCIKFNEYDS